MMNQDEELRCSQLVDGELSSDETNELLLQALDNVDGREKIKALLRLRQSTAQWRRRGPSRPMVVLAGQGRQERTGHPSRVGRRLWRIGSFAVAACVGGLLVLTGIWGAGGLGRTGVLRPDVPEAIAQVSPEQMQQVAKIFALHESVAGPLAWYAADDQNIRLASARGTEAGQSPIGVLLKLESATPDDNIAAGSRKGPRTLVIVCRNDESAVIELPAESGDRAGLRVYLTPRTINGKVEMQYAIVMDGQPQQAPLASLSGQRSLSLAEAPLGQLAMGGRVLNVEAAAWPIRQQEHK